MAITLSHSLLKVIEICFKKHTKKVSGDKQREIPRLNPMTLPLVEIIQNNFRLTLKDLNVYGLENSTLTDIK